MRFAKLLFSTVFCITCLLPVSPSTAGDEFFLSDGTRALIRERQLILIRPDSKQTVAPPGSYETSDGRTTILVNEKGILIQERKKELR
jgi:hypothetical protein